MRLVPNMLLVLGLLVSACGGSEERGDGAATGDEAVSVGIPNTIGLRLVYDTKSSSIRATVKQELGGGEILRLNVRRGRLSAQNPTALDCSKLPIAPPMATDDPTVMEAHYDPFQPLPVEYQGPVIDPSLLATVYPTQWIYSHVSPENLRMLETQGADSIAEACVMRGNVVTDRVQTTIANAWDNNDPLLAGHPLTDPAMATANVTPTLDSD